MSPQILDEIAAKLVEKGIEDEHIIEFVAAVGRLALYVPGHYIVYRLDHIDPDDNMVLAAALESSADYLVSLDGQHVLPLKHYRGTQILNPILFIRMLDQEQQKKPPMTD